MLAKIFTFSKPTLTSVVVSNRNARWLSETIGVQQCWDETIADEPLDVLIIVGGAFAFCKPTVLAALGSAVLAAGEIIWCQNDYLVIPPKTDSGAKSPFRAAFREREALGKPRFDYWTTVEVNSRATERSRLINWNQLAWDPLTITPPPHQSDLFYYGSWRDGRGRYFDKYFASPYVPTTISGVTDKFERRYNCTFVPKMDPVLMPLALSTHGLGLYIEDVKSHGQYHSPATRFYEMLSARLPVVFDPSTERMLKRAGLDVTPYLIEHPSRLPGLMERRGELLVRQLESWNRDYRDDLRGQVMMEWSARA